MDYMLTIHNNKRFTQYMIRYSEKLKGVI